MNIKPEDRLWVRGMAQAVIMGAATAGSSWMALVMANGIGLTVPQLNIKALGIILIAGAATNLFSYLRQSPLPTFVQSETTTTTKEVTKTTGE
jgi:hypothetical protein